MTEIGVQFSITDAPLQIETKTTMARRRKSPNIGRHGNLFNHHRRSHQMQYSTVLPIISLSSLSDVREKLTQMASPNKSTKQPTIQSPIPTEFRLKLPSPEMSQTKTRIQSSNRQVASNIPKSSLSYPTIMARPTTPYRSNHHHQQQQQQQQGARFLYVVNTPILPRRTTSARISNNNLNSLPFHQQSNILTAPLVPRPNPQYGHFLAYLRRQSLARMRRKQQEEGNTDSTETTVSLNSNRPTPPLFHSISSLSLATLTPETSSMPTINNLRKKRKPRVLSSYRLIPHSSLSSLTTNYRLNLNQTPPLKPLPPPPSPSPRILIKKTSDDSSLLLSHTSVLVTPTNSVVDETTISPTKKAPYELQLSGDMLNYCYVSDSGVKYQGQLLSTPV